MKGYYSKIRELEKELERNQKIYSKLCRQRENLNDRKGVVMLTECMDLEIQLISVSITISSISEGRKYSRNYFIRRLESWRNLRLFLFRDIYTFFSEKKSKEVSKIGRINRNSGWTSHIHSIEVY